MPNRLRIIFIAACLDAMLPAHAADVYKCTKEDGTLAFQDTPCAADQTETTIHLAKPPRAQPAPVADADLMEPRDNPNKPLPAMHFTKSPTDLPELFNCVRAEDGTTYVSRDGSPPPHMVPLGILGGPSQSLASAYGPGGIGVSAPGMRKTPINRSPQAEVASDYVAVQDRCQPAPKEQVCIFLQQQYNEVQTKLQHASKEQQATLKPQQDELSQQLNGC